MTTTSLGLSTLILATGLMACAVDDTPPLGRLAVALSAPGPDGSTYRLLEGTQLETSGDAFFETFLLDEDSATLTFELPVGDYQVTLTHANGYTTSWPLVRTNADLSQTVVQATLVTPMPVATSIAAEVTTSLVLSFEVPGSEPVTFAAGSLAVSAEVVEVDADGALLDYGGSQVSVTEAHVHDDAPPALADYWPDEATTALSFSVHGTLGKWTQRNSTRVCAELEVEGIAAVGHAAFTDIVLNSVAAPPASADVCIDASNPTQMLEVVLVRLGPATTGPLADQGQLEYVFLSRFAAALPEPVFVDGTLDLALLDWSHGLLPMTGFLEVTEVTPTSEFLPWFDATLGGTIDFTVTPTLE